MPIALIAHGGAGEIPPEGVEPHRRGVERAARVGWKVLMQGGSALDAVEAAVVVMEDDPAFDAGLGSVLNRNGEVEMDAGIMDGYMLRAGAVAGVKRVANPIQLARRVMGSELTFLIASGAESYAEEIGMPLVENEQLRTPDQIFKWREYLKNPPPPPPGLYVAPQGTVGCVAVDRGGNVAAGTSTGGMRFKRPGRVGDSPLIGCGVYADGLLGGASATGWGEAITRVVLCKAAVDSMSGLKPDKAARAAIEILARRVGGTGGIILASPSGQLGFSHNTPRMAVAYITEEMSEVSSSC